MCGRIYALSHAHQSQAAENATAPSSEVDDFEERLANLKRSPSMYMAQHKLLMHEDERLVRENGESHWKVQGYRILHSHVFILGFAFLMVLDILFMVIDLVLGAFYPDCGVTLRSTSCEPNTSSPYLLHGTSGFKEDVCVKHCVEASVDIENSKLAFTSASIIILTLFIVELHVHMLILGVVRFFRNIFLALDWVIVWISLGLEIYILVTETSSRGSEANSDPAVEATTVPLIIFARSWRLLRIGHGTYKEAHDFYGEEIRKLKDEIKALKTKLANEHKTEPSVLNQT